MSSTVRLMGRRLIELRAIADWTQRDFARYSGYSERLIRKAECGGSIRRTTAVDLLQTLQASESINQTPAAAEPLECFLDVDDTDVVGLLRRWFELIFNHRRLGVIDEMTSPDVVLFAEGVRRRGREVIRQRISSILEAFDPLHLSVDNSHRDGPTAVIYWSVRKKHIGTFAGIEPTDRWIEVSGCSQVTFYQGRIVEARDHFDVDAMIRQMTNDGPRVF
ncbi:MAG: ester cyclase [Planctomycetota bacterium]